MHRMQEEADKEDYMADRISSPERMSARDTERDRIHEAYSRLGRMGGEKGGQIRREQMARGEIFTREAHGDDMRAGDETARSQRH
jgi:hypothetical protein